MKICATALFMLLLSIAAPFSMAQEDVIQEPVPLAQPSEDPPSEEVLHEDAADSQIPFPVGILAGLMLIGGLALLIGLGLRKRKKGNRHSQ